MKSLPGSQPLLGEIPPNLVAGILGRSYDAAPCLARSGSWFWRRGSWWWCRPRLLTSSLLLCSPRFLSAFLFSLTLLLSALSFSSLSPFFFLLLCHSPLVSPPPFGSVSPLAFIARGRRHFLVTPGVHHGGVKHAPSPDWNGSIDGVHLLSKPSRMKMMSSCQGNGAVFKFKEHFQFGPWMFFAIL